ncbi:hypothetical protein, partial [Burkholderia territorii]|uniref:hypothetical protein n=1 Tax=Burkholderia territorii TaxID=1503055 RepID=UPI001E64E9BD
EGKESIMTATSSRASSSSTSQSRRAGGATRSIALHTGRFRGDTHRSHRNLGVFCQLHDDILTAYNEPAFIVHLDVPVRTGNSATAVVTLYKALLPELPSAFNTVLAARRANSRNLRQI